MTIALDHPSLGAHRAGARSAAPRPSLVSLSTKRPDLVEVTVDRAVLGYIEVVDPLFVVLAGPRYDLAVEVAQCLAFEDAISALRKESIDVR